MAVELCNRGRDHADIPFVRNQPARNGPSSPSRRARTTPSSSSTTGTQTSTSAPAGRRRSLSTSTWAAPRTATARRSPSHVPPRRARPGAVPFACAASVATDTVGASGARTTPQPAGRSVSAMSRPNRKGDNMARLLLILATLVATAVVAPGAMASGGGFADPAGDATSGAPDLTAVSVDQSGGTVTFTLTPAGVAALGATHRYEVRIDSDNTVSTGSGGIDQVLVLHGPNREVSHWRWNGSAFVLSAVAGLSATASAPFRITIAAAALGDPAAIAFWVRSADLTTQGRDDAPNVDAYYVTLRTQAGPVQPGPVQPGDPSLPPPPAPPPFGDLPQLPRSPLPPRARRPVPAAWQAGEPRAGSWNVTGDTVAGRDVPPQQAHHRQARRAALRGRFNVVPAAQRNAQHPDRGHVPGYARRSCAQARRPSVGRNCLLLGAARAARSRQRPHRDDGQDRQRRRLAHLPPPTPAGVGAAHLRPGAGPASGRSRAAPSVASVTFLGSSRRTTRQLHPRSVRCTVPAGDTSKEKAA